MDSGQNKIEYKVTTETLIELGIVPEDLARYIKRREAKTNVYCYLYHKVKGSPSFTCPWPEQCVHKRGNL